MAIKFDKVDDNVSYSEGITSHKISEMTKALRFFCITLTDPSSKFSPSAAFDELQKYVSKYDRLLYAEISNYCYHLENNCADTFQANLNALLEYVYSDDFDKQKSVISDSDDTEKSDLALRDKTRRIIIKLYDNVNLACAQMNSLKRSEEELQIAVNKELSPLKEDIIKDMSAQLISLVGIFTAIAFLLFGGLDSLMSIFSGLANQSLARLTTISSLWGLVVCNGIFILLSCIEKLIQKQPLNKLTITSSISRTTNLFLITILLISLWVNVIDTRNLGGVIIDFINKHNNVIGIIGFIIIIVFFIINIIIIKRSNKKSK